MPLSERVAGKLTSTYVDVYSDELYQILLRNAKERKDLNKIIRKINKDLVSFPQTEDIIENRQVYGVSATDVQKILNLKHAWEFLLDRDCYFCILLDLQCKKK